MDKKEPIPFQPRKRQRDARKGPTKSKAKSSRRQPASRVGEMDDVREYWHRFFQHPFSGPGRYQWTERMLWGNALLAALLTTVGIGLELGLHFLFLFTTFINVFFLFFLVYYLFPWVADWILRQLKVRGAFVDPIKLELIVLSGWLAIASLFRLIPYYGVLPRYAAFSAFTILMLFALRRQVRSSWTHALLAWAGGVVSIAIIMLVLQY